MKFIVRFGGGAKLASFLLLCGHFCVTRDTSAQSVGVNFVGAAGPNGTLAGNAVAGVPAVAQQNWNNAEGSIGSLTTLIDSTGQSTAIAAEWRDVCGVGDNGSTQTGNNFTLMRGSLEACLPGSGIAFRNIPYQLYDLIVYMSGPASAFGPGTLFYRSLDFDTFPPAAEGFSPQVLYSPTFSTGEFIEATPTAAGNYYVFRDLTYRDIAVGSIYFPLSAVQVVPVPEPSTTLLALFGVIAIGALQLKLRVKAKALIVQQ
jgi:hypothetical protein